MTHNVQWTEFLVVSGAAVSARHGPAAVHGRQDDRPQDLHAQGEPLLQPLLPRVHAPGRVVSRDSPCGGALLCGCEEEGFNGWGVRSEEGGGWYLFFLSFCFVFVFFLTSLLLSFFLLSLFFFSFFLPSFLFSSFVSSFLSSFLPSFLSSFSVLI